MQRCFASCLLVHIRARGEELTQDVRISAPSSEVERVVAPFIVAEVNGRAVLEEHAHDFIVAAGTVLPEVAMKKRAAATVSRGEE